ncbi:M1 family metallopeptidase [Geomonas anaerohicana]|uniref:M1 family peptidase n=1 Tax=Geomonas anaerohicana TaxID=2798583 RepID=A0ABS0YBV0_9BACT|nr:M1 family aminopeptidase [Geomonas anaerohicana]MBJ6749799.1 M1 family peptidase [Geomonas anaerohicana]
MLSSLLFMLLLAFSAEPAAASGAAAVLSQDIAVTLDPPRHELGGESRIAFAPGSRKVRLRLAKQARVDSVRCAGRDLPFTFRSGAIELELPQGETSVALAYHASFNDQVARHPAAGEDPSYGVNATIGSEGTFLGGGAYWYPVPEQVPASRKVTVSAPAGTEAITFGARLARETSAGVTRSVWQETRPVGGLSLCAGPYLVEERKAAGITLYSYFYRDNAQLAPRYLDAAAKYLTLYQELFGPYPFEKFAVVENFFPTGYGFPSFTLLGGSVIKLPFIVDTSLPHEIAHSWWGNGIDVDLSEGNWCEGLVTYLADYLLKERRSQAEAAEYRRQLLIDYASLVTTENDFPLTAFVSRNDPASRAIGYGKAAMVFHMIRSRIGDEAFFSALRELARQRMYRSASWSDLLAAFVRASGQDLAPIRPLIERKGGARLALSGAQSRRLATGWQVTGTLRQSPPYFGQDVPLRLETAAGALTRPVPVPAQGAASFDLAAPGQPQRLLLDPDAEIFRVLSPGEIPATVNSIKGAGNLIGVITRNCRVERGSFRAFLASLSQGKAAVVDEADLKPGQAARHDLLFCGLPGDPALLPAGAETISRGGATEQGDTLTFTVLQRSAPEQGVVALFEPGSPAAAVQYGPKVTHYGKYGYLLFSGGANRRKATAPPADGGAVVRFPGYAP